MKKSLSDYEASILQYHVELQSLPDYHPIYEKTQDKLSRQLSAWSKKLDITIHVASNEQQNWTESELGYPTVPMQLKKQSHVAQVGDYQAILENYNMFVGVLVERKGSTRVNGRMINSDLYSSFAKKDNRRRFYAEIGRFRRDVRFDTMCIISECSRGEYLSYKPSFNGKQWNTCNYGMNVESRRATIAKLEMMGVHVDFAGTRHEAIEHYRNLIIQWIRQNYVTILNFEE